MIRTGRTNNPSHYIRKRTEKMSAEQIGPGEFRVTPEPGKVVRIVKFHVDGSDIAIECFAEESKRSCRANECNRLCAHVNAAIALLLEDGKSS